MEISQTVAAANANVPTTPDLSTKGNISADFETFLKMLTVQMQNQDPLNPVDSGDYATQLATFSGVEQQVQTNDLLRGLNGQMGAGGLASLAGWVGMEARAAGPAYFEASPLTVVPSVKQGADAAQLVVRDEYGQEVQRLEISTNGQPLQWAGVNGAGNPLKSGNYSFETVSYVMDTVSGEAASDVYSMVTEVQLQDGQNYIVLKGGAKVPAADVTAVRQAGL